MQLKIQRSQRAAAISGKVIFCLDARVYFTSQEQANITKYRLHNQCIYNSEAAKRQLEAAAQAHAEGSYFKTFGRLALTAMNKNIWVSSLEKGEHIECKDMDELLGAEGTIMEACEKLKYFLETAATFDGREAVIDFSTDTPTLIAPARPVGIPASAPAPQPPPMIQMAPATAPPTTRAPVSVRQSSDAYEAPGASAATFDAPRDTAAFPNAPEWRAIEQWLRLQGPVKRIGTASILFIVIFPLLFGSGAFLIGMLLLAAWIMYDLLVLNT